MEESQQPPTPFPLDPFARVLVDTTEALVCVFDREGRILLFNEAASRATGFAPEDVIGRDAGESVIPAEERTAFRELLAYLWKTGFSSPRLGHWMTADGGRRLVSWSNRLLVDAMGEPLCLVTSGLDLTGRVRQREEDAQALEDDPELRLAQVGRLAQEQRALRRVATLVASEVSPEQVFMVVSEESARVIDVDASAVMRYEADGSAVVMGRHHRDGVDTFHLGERFQPDDASSLGRVRRTGSPARVDDWGAQSGAMARRMARVGYRSTASAPIVVAGQLWGAVAIGSSDSLPPQSEARLGAFCELVSLAVASAQAREDLHASRARVVKAGDEQRRRLERNLHDGAQQRLVSVALMLRIARQQLAAGRDGALQVLEQAAHELDAGLEELRELARGLHPGALAEHGLLHALEALQRRLALPIELDVEPARMPENLEATAYYIVAEALTNVTRHAGATRARVTVTREDGVVRVEIADDGEGGADATRGTGLIGLRDRAEAARGTLAVVSPPGGGTVITASLPLADD